MLNKLTAFIREQALIAPGDRIVCAVSGGADSVALLFAMYLLREKLDIQVEAAHFNHCLRGEESDRDEAFVRDFCGRYDIPLHVGAGQVCAGKKGLEAAAREARYQFLEGLPGRIATAHTADDNAETVLLHLIRGTGLKGLGGIAPRRGKLIRPMLSVTRREVEAFLEEWSLPHVEDSSNGSDAFLRNRIRRGMMPLLKEENPRISENLSAMALGLREEEAYLSGLAAYNTLPTVGELRELPRPVRLRMLERFLKDCGVREPEEAHLKLAEGLVFSQRPSARAAFPGGVTLERQYDRLTAGTDGYVPGEELLPCPGEISFLGYRVTCRPAAELQNSRDTFTVCPQGAVRLRVRQPGDALTLPGGTKSLKKLLIDEKIPRSQRDKIPVVCDDVGILGVCSIGAHQKRTAAGPGAVTIHFEKEKEEG